MDIPRFSIDQVNPRLAGGDIGDAFQRFVYEVLREDHPALHLFNAAGKDGAIDLSATEATSRLVVECKHIGAEDDGLAAAEKAWRGVAGRLAQHLADSQGPTPGQSQYGPWYRTDPSIGHYIFCTSARVANDAQLGRLRDEIQTFFRDLATSHAHLSHLDRITVEVLDWNDLCGRLPNRAHLVFRWFPRTRPQGLIPLDEAPERGTFRAYLSNNKLHYYSRAEHLRVNPAHADTGILDEDAILSELDDRNVTGLIITGGGGVGKTRLMLELGRLATRKDWTVLRVQSRLREDAIELLAETLTPDDRVVLLVDYLETQRDFPQMVEKICDLNDSLSLRLCYIANCRTGYYGTGSLAAASHKKIDLSGVNESEPVVRWNEGFRKQTVRHILGNSGIEVTESHLAVCRDVPILAVFLSYLYGTGRRLELAELLREADFSAWVRKRAQLSFGESGGDPAQARSLAKLAAMLPADDSATYHPEIAEHRFLFDRLAADGWIEKLPRDEFNHNETWVAAHDVLADQILLSYCSSIPSTVEHFVSELLASAAEAGCLRSAFVALQRNGDRPVFGSVDWLKVLGNAIATHPAKWRAARDLIMRAALLEPIERIAILGARRAVWDGAEQETEFQNSLGWLARWAAEQENHQPSSLDPELRTTLVSFIERAAGCASSSNFLLTSGTRFCPENVREAALNWILTKPRLFQTHYLLVMWLDQRLPLGEVAEAVQLWVSKFRTISHLSFVAKAWLDAGGDKELVREHIKAWLGVHQTDNVARFVYKSWLDSAGDKELVREHIKAWLGVHQTDDVAQFVYKSWLDAAGDKELVREHIMAWLAIHQTDDGAEFVYKSRLDAGGDKELVREHIKAWLGVHQADDVARFVYKSWLDAGGDKELVREHIMAWLGVHQTGDVAEFVYQSWLDAAGDNELVREHIKAWLGVHQADDVARFVYKSWLDAGGDKELVREHLREWLQVHGVKPDSDFVYRAWLEAGGEFSLVRLPAVNWLHQNAERPEAVYLTKILIKQVDLPTETVRDILIWCRAFPTDEDALWRLTKLRKRLLIDELAEEVCLTAEVVLRPLLDQAQLTPIKSSLITSLFCYLIDNTHFEEGERRNRIDALFLPWLRHAASYGGDFPSYPSIQRRIYFWRVVDLILSSALHVEGDRDALERFLRWINNWEPRSKATLHTLFRFVRRKHPVSGLWDIVDLPDGSDDSG